MYHNWSAFVVFVYSVQKKLSQDDTFLYRYNLAQQLLKPSKKKILLSRYQRCSSNYWCKQIIFKYLLVKLQLRKKKIGNYTEDMFRLQANVTRMILFAHMWAGSYIFFKNHSLNAPPPQIWPESLSYNHLDGWIAFIWPIRHQKPNMRTARVGKGPWEGH